MVPRSYPSRENINNALLIAHRGAHCNRKGILENTMAAFEQAEKAGCWGIEFDVHQTKDKVFVVNHDPTLHRLWNKPVDIRELTFEELRQIAPGVPTLPEVIRRFSNSMHLLIELKHTVHDEALLQDVLQPIVPCKDFHFLALDPVIYQSISSFPKRSQLLVAVHNNMSNYCKISLDEGFGGVLGNYVLLTNSRIKQLKEADQLYGVGFVETKNGLFRELNRGIAWLFTNNAEKIGRFLRDLQRE
ncbi:glycerophosphoryl diester phosphodiesterase [Legionella waltersii]|uniref:Glycerophosphoryl diester phosphodiesterase n=2 Tax=Legionella waltersii TaxID=66969 RepID=A0A0W1A542_9GAMM|nr:glycerophosphoryl diester phosphodiesterase [Legionella waltersii]SNV14565.1 glycerophosphoryl diester phosphodiesterase [Legionella waltersii]